MSRMGFVRATDSAELRENQHLCYGWLELVRHCPEFDVGSILTKRSNERIDVTRTLPIQRRQRKHSYLSLRDAV